MTIPHQHTDPTDSTFTCCMTAMPWPMKAEDRTCPECGTVWKREPVDIGAGARIKACPCRAPRHLRPDGGRRHVLRALRGAARVRQPPAVGSRRRPHGQRREPGPVGCVRRRCWLNHIEQAMSQVPDPEPAGTGSPALCATGMVTVPRDDLRLAVSALRDLAAHGAEPLGDFAGSRRAREG